MTLEEITAVRGVRINRAKQSVLVGFDANYTSEQKLKDLVNVAGFQVAPSREELYRLEIFGFSEQPGVAA
jgi:copper chaperone CopZ